jgi:hypothetical protein
MIDRITALTAALEAGKAAGAAPGAARADDPVLDIAQRSFRLALLQALDRTSAPGPAKTGAPPPPVPAAAPPTPARDETPSGTAPGAIARAATAYTSSMPPSLASAFAAPTSPVDERRAIQRAAARAGVDPAFLQALRRTENGGPGREFGVLSVPAPTYEDQVRVAAETVKRNVERFEGGGGRAVDAASGRYTPEFVAFFSRRYAPVGAANDPSGLNRHHARNLLRLYTDAVARGVA